MFMKNMWEYVILNRIVAKDLSFQKNSIEVIGGKRKQYIRLMTFAFETYAVCFQNVCRTYSVCLSG